MRRAVMIGILLLGAACGKSTTKTEAGGAAPVKLSGTVNNHGNKDAGSGTLEIEADTYYFEPTFIKAPAPGQTLNLQVKNTSKVPHTFTTADGSVDQVINPGTTMTITVKAPSSGALQFHCRFHESSGMQGAIYLNAGDTVSSSGTSGSGSSGGSGGGGNTTTTSGSGYGY